MLSRSSSAYQPLDSAAGINESGNSTQGKGNSKGTGESSGGGAHEGKGESDIHEMTSIAVISQNPLGTGATPTISTVPVVKSIEVGGGTDTAPMSKLERMQGRGQPTGVDIDFSYNRSRMSDKTGWTNFHFVMCIGIIGFFIFWVFILCRMYLPPEYQFMNPHSEFYYPDGKGES